MGLKSKKKTEDLAPQGENQIALDESVKKKKESKFKKWVKKHKILTILIALLLIIAIVVGAVLIKNHSSSSNTTTYSFVRTTTLSKGDLEDSISTTGSILSTNTSSVTTSLNYTIKSVSVAVGDVVSEGDTICTLDTSELETQIEKEEENLAKQISQAASTLSSAKESYSDAKSELSSYKTTLSEAEDDMNSAYTPYIKALNSISSYQSAYDTALTNYNNAATKFVSKQSAYNTALSNYKKGNATKAELRSAAKAYLTAAANLYGKCTVGTYDISDSGSGTSSSSNEMGGGSSSSSSSITVSSTVEDICKTVVKEVKAQIGETLAYSTTGDNTLYKLNQKALALQSAKTTTNYETLASAYETAKSTYENAETQYSQLQSQVEQAKSQYEDAQESYEDAQTSDTLDELNEQLEKCTITAESSGTITSLNATVGNTVSSMNSIATIQDLDNLKISITISEDDINNAEIGQTCNITTDASESTYTGTLTQLDPISENGSFGAEVTIDGVNSELTIGMNAKVVIIVSVTSDVFTVPIDAVGTDDENGSYVYKQTGGSGVDMTFDKVYVTTGTENDYYIEISSDELNEGDVIRSSADLTQGIETTEVSEDTASGLSSLFSSLGGGGDMGGDMPSGDMSSSDMPSSSGGGSSSGSFSGGGNMPSGNGGGMGGGQMGG